MIRTAPADSNIFLEEIPVNNKLGPSFSVKEMNRNTSAETDDTKTNSQQGSRRVSNKFQIGAPSNYDKIKSMREQKVKDKNVTKLHQPPDPVCRIKLPRCLRGFLQEMQGYQRLSFYFDEWRRSIPLLHNQLALSSFVRRPSLQSRQVRRNN